MGMRVMLFAVLLAAGAVRADDAKNAGVSKKVNGTWQLTKGVVGGNALPEAAVKKLQLALADGKYTLTGAESPDVGTYTLHLDQKPLGLDVKGTDGPNKGKTFLCIFELRGDKMKVCYDLAGKQRPAKFESKPKTAVFLAEYKRVKK